jgi:DNA-binding XRE family transcriptional regulator
MATRFAHYMRGLEGETRAEGPDAVAQLKVLRDHFRLGRQLAEARLKHKLTQQQVAKLSQIDQADVSKIERGLDTRRGRGYAHRHGRRQTSGAWRRPAASSSTRPAARRRL